MNFGFSYLPHSTVTILLHLDSGERGSRGAIVASGVTPRILYTTSGEEKAVPSSPGGFSIALASLSSVLDDLVSHLASHSAVSKVDQVVCVLPAPYYSSRTVILRSRSEERMEITPHLVSSLIAESKRDASRRKSPGQESEILTRSIVTIKLNGYHAPSPFGKISNEIEIALFETRVRALILEKLRHQITRHFRAPIVFEPFSLAMFVAVRNNLCREHDFMFLVVGAEAAELSLVKECTITESVSFPFGSYSLLTSLSRHLSTTPHEALCSLSLYLDNRLTERERERVAKAVEAAREVWLSSFEKATASLSSVSLPRAIFVVADGLEGRIFDQFLKSDSFTRHVMPAAALESTLISTDALLPCIAFEPSARHDHLLALESLFIMSQKHPVPIPHLSLEPVLH